MEEYFVLDETGQPQRELDPEAWTRWFEQAHLGIARTAVTPHVTVLTTFTGVRAASEEPLRLYETRIFGGVLDGEEIATSTRAEALEKHAELAAWCRIGNAEDYGIDEAVA